MRIVGVAALAAMALAAGSAQAQRTFPGGGPEFKTKPNFVLRCQKLRDRANVINAGQQTVPNGARIDVSMWEPDGTGPAVGTGLTDQDIASGASWIHPIKFSATASRCEAKVIKMPGDVPL